MKINIFIMACMTAGVLGCGCQKTDDGNAHFTADDMDLSVKPGEDFFQYANGGWLKQHPLPSDKSRFGTFDLLYDENLLKLKGIVEAAQNSGAAQGTPEQKIGDLYSCGMDTVARNADGYNALKPYLADIQAKADNELPQLIAEIHAIGVNPFFGLYAGADMDNSEMNIANLYQSGLGLPNRNYYFDESENGLALQKGYIDMLTKMAELIGFENASERAQAVFNFEKQLAEMQNTPEENRDPVKQNNKSQASELNEKYPSFDWNAYFAAVGVAPEIVNVAQVKYFTAVGNIIKAADKNVVKDYMSLRVIRSYASDLSSDFETASFDFYGRQLSGQKEQKPLWKRILGDVEGAMGEQLGQVFVQKYFPQSAKDRTRDLIEHLRTAFGERIEKLAWMGDSTKLQAKDKLAAITIKIGFPDKWRDYSGLEISREAGFAANIIATAKFETAFGLAKIGKPVDHTEWYMTPQTVNAYYDPSSNEIVFPAGILQPPFFYAEGDDAVNYGGIGVVIGHEMTHGFDDQGSQFDKVGNLKNWWTAEDKERFSEATKRLADHFASFVAVDTMHINGMLTLGENIADLGGLNISYQAYHNAVAGKDVPQIDGLTGDQRFMLSYARVWAQNSSDEYLRQQINTDPHSPGKFRTNGQMCLFAPFYNAFGIAEGDSLYRAPEQRIVIW
ncbi:MAG: M13 family metallopeptidase [Marinilabiliaceae bacterium]|nr:M13 family metallopeptidase [Marinilabiliaceae bacterium]